MTDTPRFRRNSLRGQIFTLEVGEYIDFPLWRRATMQSLASRAKKGNDKIFTVQRIGEDLCRLWRLV